MFQKTTLFIFVMAFALSVSYMNIASAKSATLTGSIEKVSFKEKKITIKEDQGNDSKTFDLSVHTRYLVKGKPVVEGANLKEGDKVKIEVNSKNTVLTVDIQAG